MPCAECKNAFILAIMRAVQAHGVYEGNYWQLLGDLVELEGILEKLAARAPEEQQEPALELPPPPVLPL